MGEILVPGDDFEMVGGGGGCWYPYTDYEVKTLFEFCTDKQHWEHSICDNSLFNFDVLKIFFS